MRTDPRVFSESSTIEQLEASKKFFQNVIAGAKRGLENLPTDRSAKSVQSFLQRTMESLKIGREKFTEINLLLEEKTKPPEEMIVTPKPPEPAKEDMIITPSNEPPQPVPQQEGLSNSSKLILAAAAFLLLR